MKVRGEIRVAPLRLGDLRPGDVFDLCGNPLRQEGPFMLLNHPEKQHAFCNLRTGDYWTDQPNREVVRAEATLVLESDGMASD